MPCVAVGDKLAHDACAPVASAQVINVHRQPFNVRPTLNWCGERHKVHKQYEAHLVGPRPLLRSLGEILIDPVRHTPHERDVDGAVFDDGNGLPDACLSQLAFRARFEPVAYANVPDATALN